MKQIRNVQAVFYMLFIWNVAMPEKNLRYYSNLCWDQSIKKTNIGILKKLWDIPAWEIIFIYKLLQKSIVNVLF